MVCDEQINLNTAAQADAALCTFTAGTFRVKEFVRVRQEMDSPLQKWLLAVLKRMLGVRDTTPQWCIMRECGLEPL
jgi:hypothetical protein